MGPLSSIEINLACLRSKYNQAAGQLEFLKQQRDEKQVEH